MRRRSRGFTLVELMVAVAIVGIIAALSLISVSKNRSRFQVDNWVSVNRDVILTASRRAITTHQPFMAVFTATTAQWCQVPFIGTPPAYTDASTTCPAVAAAGKELGRLNSSANTEAISVKTAVGPDIFNADGTYTSKSTTALGTAVLYFGRSGSSSTSMANVLANGIPTDATSLATFGFTLYITRKATAAVADVAELHRRIVVYGLTTKTRTIPFY